MSHANTATSYGSIAKFFHWTTALLIITLIPLGIIANGAPFTTGEELAFKATLFSLHKTLGLVLFAIALARIGWAFTQPKPAPLHSDRKLEHFMAELVHWLLYGSLVLVPLTGWIHHASTSGFAPIWWPFGQDLPFVPKDQSLADLTAGLHIVFERVLAASVILHIAGALKHAIIDRDDTLRRMLPWRSVFAGELGAKHSALPLAAALVVWAGALMIGGALGVYAKHGSETAQITLEQTQSDWVVESGEIALTVTQFGSAVSGQFADWTSDISFDAASSDAQKGTVRTVIAIPSLSLGSVTDQAMGADFFDASTHATAVFEGDIFALADATYEARGTLEIKGASQPVTLPFAMTITDGKAEMAGNVTLNRLDFGIGANMPDESSLAFAVEVAIKLSATRAK